ncbi:MAG: tandem-95 repeat protein [Kouleothrix sp.]|nr:tandem-95 repeat protein [Kouleothrix sp.]
MKTFRGFRPIYHLARRPHWFLAAILVFGLLLLDAPWAFSASVSIAGPTTLAVSGNYVGGTNGYNGTSWSAASTNFAYRLSGTPAGKNNRNTPNATGDTSGTLDPTLSSLTYFTMLPDGTVTISGTFTSALGAADFSTYGGQFLSIGLINEPWVEHAKSGYSSDMFTSASGADGNAYLLFYRETQGAPVFASMEDHAGGRATAADRRDIGGLGAGVTAFSIQFQSGVDKSGGPATGGVRGRMRYSLNGGAYGAWDNNSHDFVGQNTAILLAATTSKGYSFGATLGTVDINTSPVANDDSYTVNEDATLTVAAPGVLANDSDPDGDPFVGALASGPSHGALSFSSDGSFSYTPDANYNGSDSFSYKARDTTNLESGAATVRLTITPVDDVPTAAADSYSTAEDTVLNVVAAGVLANDSDPDTGDTLSAVLVSGPSHGALTLNADGSFGYTPDANYNGPDSFSYLARDTANLESGAATVRLTITPVNDVPTAHDDSYSTAEDTPLNVPAAGVLANDDNPDGGSLGAVLASGPSHGALALNADGSFAYTPDANYNGADSFSYLARDAQADGAAAGGGGGGGGAVNMPREPEGGSVLMWRRRRAGERQRHRGRYAQAGW